MKYDILIIGAGLGGLTAGAKLAREGRKVLIIEQHSKPGGCATTFQRGCFTLEVGLHEMDGPSPRDMKTRIFTDLEVFKNVEFIQLPEFYRFINNRYDLIIPHEPEIAEKRLSEIFPNETKGIKAYFDQILSNGRKSGNKSELDTSVGNFLDSIINNDDLKLILLGNLGYFHDDPFSLSLAYYSVAQGSYYTGHASYIKGGSQKLSDHLKNYIHQHGGEVLLGNLVTNLIVEKNRLTGVSYIEKKRIPSDSLTVYADEIILNAAMPNVAELLPEEYRTRFLDEIKGQKPGASLLTIYFGFKNSLINHHYSTFVFDDSVKTQKDILNNNRGDFKRRSFTFVDYGQIESGLAPEGRSVGALCCIDYLTEWENLSQEQYKAKKEEVANIFIARLEKIIPGISDQIEYIEVATPSTVKRYTLNPEGAVYGFARTPLNLESGNPNIFDNLHFASAWGKTGGGFSGAIYGGYLCAINILRKR